MDSTSFDYVNFRSLSSIP